MDTHLSFPAFIPRETMSVASCVVELYRTDDSKTLPLNFQAFAIWEQNTKPQKLFTNAKVAEKHERVSLHLRPIRNTRINIERNN